jgi:hypothetical protein
VVGQTDPIACSVQTLLLILKYSREHIPYFCDYQVIQLMVKETQSYKGFCCFEDSGHAEKTYRTVALQDRRTTRVECANDLLLESQKF